MTLSSPLKTQLEKLENTTTSDVLSQLKHNLATTGQKCIDYLGKPRPQGEKTTKGKLGEAIAFYNLSKKEYDVRIEHSLNYDLTIHGEKGITRIQVKTLFWDKYTNTQKTTVRKKKNKQVVSYALTDFDFLAVVDVESEEVYLVPIFEVESSRNLGYVATTLTMNKLKSYKI